MSLRRRKPKPGSREPPRRLVPPDRFSLPPRGDKSGRLSCPTWFDRRERRPGGVRWTSRESRRRTTEPKATHVGLARASSLFASPRLEPPTAPSPPPLPFPPPPFPCLPFQLRALRVRMLIQRGANAKPSGPSGFGGRRFRLELPLSNYASLHFQRVFT